MVNDVKNQSCSIELVQIYLGLSAGSVGIGFRLGGSTLIT